jgi:hypothetical protein
MLPRTLPACCLHCMGRGRRGTVAVAGSTSRATRCSSFPPRNGGCARPAMTLCSAERRGLSCGGDPRRFVRRLVEGAELTCDRSGELAARAGSWDVGSAAIDLLRAADHDETTLRHALRVGRSRVRRTPADRAAKRGVQLLEDVIAFLGVRPRAGDADASASAPPDRKAPA